jgi:hypothetical protein
MSERTQDSTLCPVSKTPGIGCSAAVQGERCSELRPQKDKTVLTTSALLWLERRADVSRRYFLRLSRPHNTDRAPWVLDSRPEKDFDFPDAIGGSVHDRVAYR